ncbi:MAG: 30S ribosomal protein S20 [Candidatus Wildermuthbacteria bacterium RIFCSPHIGHO2_01_FULL_48_25]|uniref:Small ribosomal subunit protein bS20 n=1 Tax=Candidatus Wildermuthbacteria bacterium RIFCSPLOWO2_01_FULL_48_16 TaxID=1802461 RepID=A0A1G2RJQ2_9BACT|nr:MAG: 30S ribosomal protein S20 [Candidatus Wildermuthbacteria bacterium RIFCSPHIGHO2_01_FULL_48_25]OHA73066.1 MAG: 30S ribosomal protein S20 [Candidatus Wildermuthbacteria bacterium RIFCSPLOWO2_01_FULL_48_16]
MPITSSAKKALRQSAKRKIQNAKVKKATRLVVKQFRGLLAQKDKDNAKKLMPQLMKFLDKATKTGVLKKNTVSRLKSRAAKALAKLS